MMTIYHRASDGAADNAERWDGRPDTEMVIWWSGRWGMGCGRLWRRFLGYTDG